MFVTEFEMEFHEMEKYPSKKFHFPLILILFFYKKFEIDL